MWRERVERQGERDWCDDDGMMMMMMMAMMMAMMAMMMMMMKCQFHWWRKLEHPEETKDLQQVTDKLSHMYLVCAQSQYATELGPQLC